jgi:hypothetical protein
MSRRVFLLGLGIVLVAVGLAFTDWALSLRPGVTEANVKRVRPGMTQAEVEGILGGKGLLSYAPGASGSRASVYLWRESDRGAFVVFGPDGAVTSAGFERDSVQNPLARLRSWLGW